MKLICAKDYKGMCRQAANILSAQLIIKPDSVLGLATGSTPVGIYAQLIDWYNKGDLSFAEASSVNLDEYQGLAPDHPQSYRYFMQHHLFDHVDMRPEATHVPNGLADDSDAECKRYNQVIRSMNGVDLQLLGVGHNGHIAFNEPGEAFELETHLVPLAPTTVEANKRFFDSVDDVPTHAYSMGVKSIMSAKKILLMVSGKDKAAVLAKAFSGPVTPEIPASVLQLHPNVVIVGDHDALHLLMEQGGVE
ncbi:glucosamine-6-phosphate deaminase [Bengtsoniella intestinalis]|uniref:glucosamine-6-phosphate deaminase n=1 Tax=Bengtsoniella intestinalis TaxID=3073143 RepID=UPI00391F655A